MALATSTMLTLLEQFLALDRGEWSATEARQWSSELRDTDKPPHADRMAEISNRLTQRLAFGTAGLRAKMGCGYDRMNHVTVFQTTQGVLSFLYHLYGVEKVKQRGIAVGYDSRHHSTEFAATVSTVLLEDGVRVHLHSRFVATPLLAMTVLAKECVAGIMITASHNPATDNGYKLYLENGCQINSPHDTAIEDAISANLHPWRDYVPKSIENLLSDSLVSSPTEEVMQLYVRVMVESLRFRPQQDNAVAPRVVYTAFHGVGEYFVRTLCSSFGFPALVPVVEQVEPNPDFPTVKFPNPEEGKGALQLAIQTADRHGCRYIFANDPDADRFSVAERVGTPDGVGNWYVFNGNEMAALFAAWLWSKRPVGLENDTFCMVRSTVSSKALAEMARVEGFQCIETLTGFKWIAAKVLECKRSGLVPLFAYEEAIGFMCSTAVHDKDGISALAVMYELIGELDKRSSTLLAYLRKFYDSYGYHISRNHYLLCKDPSQVTRIMTELRKRGFPSTFGDASVISVRDLTRGTDTMEPDGQAKLPSNASSQFVTFRIALPLENGDSLVPGDSNVEISLRASGTEPKLKYYSEIRCNRSQTEHAAARLEALVDLVIQTCLDPIGNGLIG
ncbi:putative phosphoglucomutase-2 [Porphyridium purpureum]|uniref:Putative phosphoglucomutase-2 n=1 Tax=Porphyridium purpureum TaxID=35688 RepID=A0A5J4Z9B5_PORPP|nr:putative phosphoglucomutase-2 [Porphyridium purpureum]|eukprot:POR0605..scf295_1